MTSPFRREGGAVPRIVDIARLQFVEVRGRAELVQLVIDLVRGPDTAVRPIDRLDLDVLEAGPYLDPVELRQRDPVGHVKSIPVRGIPRDIGLLRIDLAVEHGEAPTRPGWGVVRIGYAHFEQLVDVAGAHLGGEPVARPEEVVLRQARGQQQALVLRKTGPQGQRPRLLLRHRYVQVHLVIGAGNSLGLHVHALHERQSLDPHTRTLDQRAVVPGALHLAKLAAIDTFLGVLVSGDPDIAHIDARARVDKKRDRYLTVVLVHVRDRIDVRERETFLGQALADALGGFGHLAARERSIDVHIDQLFQFLARDHELPGELGPSHGVALTFIHIEGDEQILAIGRQRHLRRIDIELQKAPIQIVRAQLLQVSGELLPRVVVAATEESPPAWHPRLEPAGEFARAVAVVADHVDLANLRHRPFRYFDLHIHPVARQVDDLDIDLDVVAAAGEILLPQFALDPVQHRPIEHTTRAQARGIERLAQTLVGYIAIAGKVDFVDRGPFRNHHHQHIAAPGDLHIVEETRLEQLADHLRATAVVEGIAHLDRQIAERGPGGNPLQSLDLDVLDLVGLAPGRTRQPQQTDQGHSSQAVSRHALRQKKAARQASRRHPG